MLSAADRKALGLPASDDDDLEGGQYSVASTLQDAVKSVDIFSLSINEGEEGTPVVTRARSNHILAGSDEERQSMMSNIFGDTEPQGTVASAMT